jgi:cytochrome P450
MLAITASLPMSSPIQTYFLAMCHYPQWQKRLQQEIDEVCGPDCLPTWADAPKLPVLRAIGKELIRWRPPVPTGVPHEAERDDVYDGYFIPKGALIHPTEWARRSDESMYPNPEEFNPDRYLNPKYPTYKEPLTKYPNVINHHVFGYGRRNCLGMEIVDYQLVTIMGSLAWAFDVTKKKNKIGIGTYRALWHISFVLTKCRHPCTHIRVDRLAHHSTGGFCVRHQAKE